MSKVAAAVCWFLLPFWAFLALFAAVRLTVGQPAPAALDWAVILGSAALSAANPWLHRVGSPAVRTVELWEPKKERFVQGTRWLNACRHGQILPLMNRTRCAVGPTVQHTLKR